MLTRSRGYFDSLRQNLAGCQKGIVPLTQSQTDLTANAWLNTAQIHDALVAHGFVWIERIGGIGVAVSRRSAGADDEFADAVGGCLLVGVDQIKAFIIVVVTIGDDVDLVLVEQIPPIGRGGVIGMPAAGETRLVPDGHNALAGVGFQELYCGLPAAQPPAGLYWALSAITCQELPMLSL